MKDNEKHIFTTGKAAQICRVSQQTIIRHFDSGRLRGYKFPGSKLRRIPRQSLIEFMKGRGIPMDRLLRAGKISVLVVDDDPEITGLLEGVLKEDGRFGLLTASGGFEAGMMTEKFRPDLVIMDYTLPDVNGVAVLQAMGDSPEFENTKVIVMSGMAKQDEIDRLLESGAVCFIRKPFSGDEIIRRIEEALGIA